MTSKEEIEIYVKRLVDITRCVFELPSSDIRLEFFKDAVYKRFTITKLIATTISPLKDVALVIELNFGLEEDNLSEMLNDCLFESKILSANVHLTKRILMYKDIKSLIVII